MENNHSVCYVEVIQEIKPIPNADNIEHAIIGGWNCVVQKGIHSVGELVIVATTDAVIPKVISDAVGVTSYLRKGQRVRTVKLRGIYSECLLLSINYIPGKYRYKGSDCMELMGIFKYEPPAVTINLSSGRKIKYQSNPNFHVYYKFPNMKNVPSMFDKFDTVQVTRKLHGTNARYGIVKKNKITIWDKFKKLFGNKFAEYEFVVGSHNVEKGSDSQGYYDANVWYEINNMYDIKTRMWDFVKRKFSHDMDSLGSGIIIYGEIYGSGIQKNYDYGLGGLEFRIFDAKLNDKYLDTLSVKLICSVAIGLPHVPILYNGYYDKQEIDKFVFNNFIEGTKIPHEGVVVKCISGDRQKIAKMINPDYLIYSEKHNVSDSH